MMLVTAKHVLKLKKCHNLFKDLAGIINPTEQV